MKPTCRHGRGHVGQPGLVGELAATLWTLERPVRRVPAKVPHRSQRPYLSSARILLVMSKSRDATSSMASVV